ncbi:HesA/MoeB/ThiF family protein [Vibrio sp. T187]|uniref:HesA/MoeB/ThiF family protein n=1 Tax=Vibrio TaxID=662 RepID=UPI0010C9E206|nr:MULTISPECIES: HesA/MoeB/ThiF family protein [Vibrio]MBW3698597.1 HesA/MoeB/ThiF family protein [Vibrio sp. T187]
MLDDKTFLRYQRQISVPEVSESGQASLQKSHVLIIGCGGLGSAASLYLAASGIGKLVLVDDDQVDSSNLQRQVVYRESDLEQPKVSAAASQLSHLNEGCQVRQIPHRLSDSQLSLEVMLADIVLDCSDNFPTRQQINAVCFAQNTPLVSASAIGWQGQFMVFDFPNQHSCYRCLYPFDQLENTTKCSDSGIIGPVVGTMGNMQALAAIQKLATGSFLTDTTQLKLFDGKSMNWTNLSMVKEPRCSVCHEV